MARIGLSKPYIASYTNSGTTVTYGTPAVIGKAVELSIELEGGSDNILYADNAPAESDNQFAGGTLSVTTDDLDAASMVSILGIVQQSISGTGVPTDAKWNVFDDQQTSPYVGFGGIVKKKINGTVKYVAIALDKVQFANPGLAVTTQGETIEWQTTELEATIMRSDNTYHSWYRMSTPCDTEAAAVACLTAFFGASSDDEDGE